MITCENCGKSYATDITPLYCRCGGVTGYVEPKKEAKPNAWNVIHNRYADAIKSDQWRETVERNWLSSEFVKIIPCSGCGSNWKSISTMIDLSTAETAFETLWEAHNLVSTQHVNPPLPVISYEKCRELWLGPKVAFIAVNYANHGGTETFHQTLLPILRHHRNIIGFGCIHGGGDHSLLKVPYFEGRPAIEQLCKQADIVVTWGIDMLTKLLPLPRPKVIALHHGDQNAGWIGETLWQTEVDEFVCVNRDAAEFIKSKKDLPVHWIPNALNLDRIKTTSNFDAIKSSVVGKKVVLFGHRFSEEKRPELAVEMTRYLPKDWILIMAGDGPLKPRVVPSNIRLVGHVDTLADWLAVSNCFVSMSTFEGFGLSMAEANAAGVPVVATPVGIATRVASELLGLNASPKQWAQAVVRSDGKQCPKADFSVEKHVAEWAKVLAC